VAANYGSVAADDHDFVAADRGSIAPIDNWWSAFWWWATKVQKRGKMVQWQRSGTMVEWFWLGEE
jgi:hypothetical protein